MRLTYQQRPRVGFYGSGQMLPNPIIAGRSGRTASAGKIENWPTTAPAPHVTPHAKELANIS